MLKNQMCKDVRSPPGNDKKAPSGWLSHDSPAREINSGVQLLQGLIV
jgi:hypothetical protein